ncbi:MAG: polysaccharide biosynthesis/export family protein, partial [Cyanobacteria bacterium J06648_11]
YIEPVALAPEPDHGGYKLDTGDTLRIYVFGQAELSRLYTVGADGTVSMPLIGSIHARGHTTHSLERAVRSKLAASFVRDPYVAIEVNAYRPFFILGEVRNPGQYPFVVGMTLDHAVAIAGGYSPRARTGEAEISRPVDGFAISEHVTADDPVFPGDRITIAERWF